jgi:hypothetical protein
MEFGCDRGHKWTTSPISILKNQWCKTCFLINKRISFYYINSLANKYNGRCLMTKNEYENIYKNNMTKILWECKNSHQFYLSISEIEKIKLDWCNQCKYDKRFNEVKQLGVNKNITLLSTEYKNNYTPLNWKCDKNHIFQATYVQIKLHFKSCKICNKKK